MAKKRRIQWVKDHPAPVGGGAVVLGLALIIGIDAYMSPEPFSFRQYQTLLTGLAAVCAALIAYAAATRGLQEARKAAEQARKARKLKTILLLMTALDQFRNTAEEAAIGGVEAFVSPWEAHNVLSGVFSVPPGLAHAVENLDALPWLAAADVSKLFALLSRAAGSLAKGDPIRKWQGRIEEAQEIAQLISEELAPELDALVAEAAAEDGDITTPTP